MTTAQKAKTSRAYGRFAFCVFDRTGELYTHTRRLLSHAVEDAKACGGEIWVNGRCTLPAWNIGCSHDFQPQAFEGPAMKCLCGAVEH